MSSSPDIQPDLFLLHQQISDLKNSPILSLSQTKNFKSPEDFLYFVFDHCFTMPLHQTHLKHLQKYFLTTDSFDDFLQSQTSKQQQQQERLELQKQI